MKGKTSFSRFLPLCIWCGVILAGLAAAMLLSRKPQLMLFLPGCLFQKLTGLYCAGCGMTRAVLLLMRGDIAGAFRMNLLGMLLVPGLAAFTLYAAILHIRGKSIPPWPNWVFWILGGVILLFALLRNLPLAPFTWLAPIE